MAYRIALSMLWLAVFWPLAGFADSGEWRVATSRVGDISESGQRQLACLLPGLLGDSEQRIELVAHSSDGGSREYNLGTADAYASPVVQWLGYRGVAAERIVILSSGEEGQACPEEGCMPGRGVVRLMVPAKGAPEIDCPARESAKESTLPEWPNEDAPDLESCIQAIGTGMACSRTQWGILASTWLDANARMPLDSVRWADMTDRVRPFHPLVAWAMGDAPDASRVIPADWDRVPAHVRAVLLAVLAGNRPREASLPILEQAASASPMRFEGWLSRILWVKTGAPRAVGKTTEVFLACAEFSAPSPCDRFDPDYLAGVLKGPQIAGLRAGVRPLFPEKAWLAFTLMSAAHRDAFTAGMRPGQAGHYGEADPAAKAEAAEVARRFHVKPFAAEQEQASGRIGSQPAVSGSAAFAGTAVSADPEALSGCRENAAREELSAEQWTSELTWLRERVVAAPRHRLNDPFVEGRGGYESAGICSLPWRIEQALHHADQVAPDGLAELVGTLHDHPSPVFQRLAIEHDARRGQRCERAHGLAERLAHAYGSVAAFWLQDLRALALGCDRVQQDVAGGTP